MNLSTSNHVASSSSLTILQMIRALASGACLILLSATSQSAFLFEIDTDGTDDGVVTFNPNFSFGGDTTTASQSITSPAYGTTGGDSIFGGDGAALADTYSYTYQPSVEADNLVIPFGTDLGGGNLASGLAGGGTGIYRVYATWPFTSNVSGGDTRYTISTVGTADIVIDIDQNGGGAGAGGIWFLLGDIDYSDLTSSINVSQMPTVANSFVSMRSYGLLFERVTDEGDIPVPATLALLALGFVGIGYQRRKQHKAV